MRMVVADRNEAQNGERTGMLYAAFVSLEDAQKHRSEHGGWIFRPTVGHPVWFSLAYTASAVMTHPATIGQGGSLV